MSFENWLRVKLDQRWRRRATQQEITATTVRRALDHERDVLARMIERAVLRLARLHRAEREDGVDRAAIVVLYPLDPA